MKIFVLLLIVLFAICFALSLLFANKAAEAGENTHCRNKNLYRMGISMLLLRILGFIILIVLIIALWNISKLLAMGLAISFVILKILNQTKP